MTTNPSNKQCKITHTSYTCMHVCCNVCQIHRTILRATVILLPLLGLTWLFGLLTLNKNATVFAWLFTIFNSLQVTTHKTLTHPCKSACKFVTMPANSCNVLSGFYLLGLATPKHFYFHPNYFSFPQSGCFILKHPTFSLSACTQTLCVVQIPLQIENPR